MTAAIEKLRQETDPPVVNQHVVSRVVLCRFARKDRNGGPELAFFNMQSSRCKVLGARGCGKIPNWMPVASNSMEKLWGMTEDQLNPVLDSVAAGKIFTDPKMLDVLRRAVALHFVRSTKFRLSGQHASMEAFKGALSSIIQNNWSALEADFVTAHGRPVASVAELTEHVLSRIQGGQSDYASYLFRVKAEELYSRTYSTLSASTLQILTPLRGREFLIGDSPACGEPKAGLPPMPRSLI